MARPPMSKFFSTISTDAPFSRAAIAATSPPAPAPITTTSTSRSQAIASAACAAGASAMATTAAPEARKLRRSIAALGRFSRSLPGLLSAGEFDIGTSLGRPLCAVDVDCAILVQLMDVKTQGQSHENLSNRSTGEIRGSLRGFGVWLGLFGIRVGEGRGAPHGGRGGVGQGRMPAMPRLQGGGGRGRQFPRRSEPAQDEARPRRPYRGDQLRAS